MARVAVEQCETCGRKQGEKHKATERVPSTARLMAWMNDGVCGATDGCVVEPDGHCEHGHSSWMLRLGLI
jgi:hypothetical protein